MGVQHNQTYFNMTVHLNVQSSQARRLGEAAKWLMLTQKELQRSPA